MKLRIIPTGKGWMVQRRAWLFWWVNASLEYSIWPRWSDAADFAARLLSGVRDVYRRREELP